MRKIYIVVLVAIATLLLVGWTNEGTQKYDNGGNPASLGVDSTETIRWIWVDSSGAVYVTGEVTTTTDDTLNVSIVPMSLTWVIEGATVGTSDSAYVFGNTPVELFIQNTHDTQNALIGVNGTDYITLFPHASFSLGNYGQDTLHIKGSGAGTTLEFWYGYE